MLKQLLQYFRTPRVSTVLFYIHSATIHTYFQAHKLILIQMLYFSVILCKGQCFYLCTLQSTQFVLVQVYQVYFPYDMFRPDGAIFRYV
jgi:hypothetical protein